ncbi:hypothetical protein BH708_04730 [Brachybacterium sp. P6-10-X1]|uniref:hypothetical protein n=1 Tax=Brachybacterium sp. P6-10-X1 TaxID=1903186 RepID=UPI000971A791|nr:hypothetical protein [Brachybacterium sp. P6-10-X1]APX32143.1 hypothetical protein BH708_04730 [Brachybacterium sp. P6-10-X1]
MILIEISCPVGRYDDTDRRAIIEQICSVVLTDDHAPPETMHRARQMAHLGFRDLTDWHTGDGPANPEEAPPVIASVTVPRAWQDDMARPMIGAVKAALRRVDTRHGWQREPGSLWVLINGVPDGSIGMDGASSTADDVLDALISDYRAAVENGRNDPVPDGHLVDPICGMLVRRGPRALTIETDGETLGFCALGCRDAYARRHALA